MSSWLLDAAGAGAAGGGAGLAGGAGFAGAACAAGMADGGMSFMTGALVGGAAAAGFSGLACAGGLEGFSVIGGLAPSLAMMRRIDAKISSIEGSWTFAGCVISDSTSSTPSHARFTLSSSGFAGSGYAGRDFHHASLTCPQIKRRATHRTTSRPSSQRRSIAAPKLPDAAPIALLPPAKVCHGNNRLQQRASAFSFEVATGSRHATPSNRPSSADNGDGDQRPSGVRTPYQLSRTY